MTDELVIEVLRGIRSDLAELRAEARATNARLDETNARLDLTRTELGGHIAEMGKTMHELAVQQRFVVRYTKTIAERESHAGEELAALRARVERIEHQIGIGT